MKKYLTSAAVVALMLAGGCAKEDDVGKNPISPNFSDSRKAGMLDEKHNESLRKLNKERGKVVKIINSEAKELLDKIAAAKAAGESSEVVLRLEKEYNILKDNAAKATESQRQKAMKTVRERMLNDFNAASGTAK